VIKHSKKRRTFQSTLKSEFIFLLRIKRIIQFIFIRVIVNLNFENVDLNKILYAQKIRNLCNIGGFDRLPVTTVFFFDYVAMICASQENGERKFSGFRVQLDGMEQRVIKSLSSGWSCGNWPMFSDQIWPNHRAHAAVRL
jgi:hypothetical protein